MLHLLTYLAAIVFAAAVAVRAIKLFRMPIHIRWELYPVPHEGRRAKYGGSYYEESEWWTQDRHFSLLGTLKYMLPEMLFLKSLWDENRTLWYRSAPFHWGLYSLGALAGLLVLGALCQMAGITVSSGSSPIGAAVSHLTILAGVVSIVLGICGAAAMLHMRLTDEDLADFTAPRELFNLGFILVAFLSMGLAFIVADRSFSLLRGHVHSLMTFKMASVGSGLVGLEMVILSLLLAYIPLTHMSHFFIKWFTYHEIRWDDAPNMRRSKIEDRIKKVLEYPVSWSAPHIKGNGKKDWGSVATEDVTSDDEKAKDQNK